MTVHVRVQPSPIHGVGVFAAEPIKAGEVVWRYHEPVDRRLALNDTSLPKWFMDRYVYVNTNVNLHEVCGDIGIFMNHSDAPNVVNSKSDPDANVAARDIAEGEELTADYRDFDEIPDFVNAESRAEALVVLENAPSRSIRDVVNKLIHHMSADDAITGLSKYIIRNAAVVDELRAQLLREQSRIRHLEDKLGGRGGD